MVQNTCSGVRRESKKISHFPCSNTFLDSFKLPSSFANAVSNSDLGMGTVCNVDTPAHKA